MNSWADRADNDKLSKQDFKTLYVVIQKILFEHDPVGINFGINEDEYAPEAGTILKRLPEAKSAKELCTIVHEEFVNWFGEETAGRPENYTNIAQAIWDIWMGKENY